MSVATQITRLTNERNRFREILKQYSLVDDTADLEECIDSLALFFNAVETDAGYAFTTGILDSTSDALVTADGDIILGDFVITYK